MASPLFCPPEAYTAHAWVGEGALTEQAWRKRLLPHAIEKGWTPLWRHLLQYWHPDRAHTEPLATDVFRRIDELRKKAYGETSATLIVKEHTGRSFQIKGVRCVSTAIGSCLWGERSLVWTAESPEAIRLLTRGRQIWKTTFGKAGAPGHTAPPWTGRVPEELQWEEKGAPGAWWRIRRPGEALPLSLMLSTLDEPLPLTQIAWMTHALWHLACCFEQQQIAHLSLTPDTLWFDVVQHDAACLGGWWTAVPYGTTLQELSPEALTVLPRRLLEMPASCEHDAWLYLNLLRTLWGGEDARIWTARGIPETWQQLVRLPPASTAVENYRRWSHVIHAALGPARFVPFPETALHTLQQEYRHG